MFMKNFNREWSTGDLCVLKATRYNRRVTFRLDRYGFYLLGWYSDNQIISGIVYQWPRWLQPRTEFAQDHCAANSFAVFNWQTFFLKKQQPKLIGVNK